MLCIKHLQEDYFCMDDVNPNVKIVHFNGINENIHEKQVKNCRKILAIMKKANYLLSI